MTRLLELAFRAAAKHPSVEQDALAEFIIAAVGSVDAEWDQRFTNSAEPLGGLADEALSEHRRGEASRLDPESL